MHAPNLKDHGPDALRRRFAAEGLPGYRAEQVAGWLYGRGEEDPRRWTDLPQALRDRLAREWRVEALRLERVERSEDGTLKGALRAADGAVIEAVLIPEEDRTTLCVSTQVGCPLACSFCATGALGFARNLRVAEIVDQVCRMRALLEPGRRITNVVFMGMGEPLLNLPNVAEAVRVLLHPKGFAFAPRRVTVSTAGVVPRIPDLLAQVPVNLAVSLHATTDEVRDVLVPLNRRFPLEALLGTLRRLEGLGRRRPVFFEYTLIEGLNDGVGDARRLVHLLRGIPSKVNVIPMNPHADAPGYRPPSAEATTRFLGELVRGGLTTTLRRSRGGDIDAACGQLAARGTEAARPPRRGADVARPPRHATAGAGAPSGGV
jgi:23S rRNA (adenine2503-C2)-methyltransferase